MPAPVNAKTQKSFLCTTFLLKARFNINAINKKERELVAASEDTEAAWNKFIGVSAKRKKTHL